MPKIIFPPRPKGKMSPVDLPYYEGTGLWVAQRKFRGHRAVLNISVDRKLTLGNRHGKQFAKFSLDKSYQQEILSGLHLKAGLEYWLDGEIMNADENSTNELILFDVLQAGRYFFHTPTQMDRLEILREICGDPQKLCHSGIALQVTPKVWMAETFDRDFEKRYKEALPIRQLEGLFLRKKAAGLDGFGNVEYETGNMIRCRKPFLSETPMDGRSGGYEL